MAHPLHTADISDTAPVSPSRWLLDRRRFLGVLALPAVAAFLQACGGDDGSTTGTTPDATDPSDTPSDTPIAKSDLARAAADPADAAIAAAALNALGADLYGALADADPTANLVFSPASIALALAMVRGGAVGSTGTEIDSVLHVDDPAGLHSAMNALSAALESRSRTVVVNDEEREVSLSIANSLWGQDGMAFEQPFLDLLASEYGAGLRLADFRTDADKAVEDIDAWVDTETKGRIPQLLAPGDLDAMTRLVVVNAIHLKASWAEQFSKEATADAPFTLLDGSTVQVPMMKLGHTFPYAAGDGWQAVELGYVGGDLAMLLVVPDAGGLDAAQTALGSGLLDEVTTALTPGTVILGLPRWDIETRAPLASLLAALGMSSAFTDDADFSAITTDEPLHISSVIHQANITVDENGTEAAAATAIALAGSSAPVDIVELTVDRPFLFALRDIATGAVVFLGRVTDPSATRG